MNESRASRGRREGPASAQAALRDARDHLRNALSEALLAARALLDAASIGLSGRPVDGESALAPLAALLEETSRGLATEDRLSGPLVLAILDALDHEIRRWEERAQDDPDARAVLRAFLGVREILWEFGLRRDGTGSAGGAPGPDEGDAQADAGGEPGDRDQRPTRRPRSRGQRVERVRVQG